MDGVGTEAGENPAAPQPSQGCWQQIQTMPINEGHPMSKPLKRGTYGPYAPARAFMA
jgi:hypothetical protein